jgi:DNA helicase HerA-like ATPase
MRTDSNGRGTINILAADKLMLTPKTYATFLLWLLSELFEKLPEAGDQEKPKLAFFFDEAHLLFNDAPKALLEKIEQVVRLIRSKAVGVYFISQNPLDIPEMVLGQLSNRVQHALRAFTPWIKKRLNQPLKLSVPIQSLTLQRQSLNWASVKRWFSHWMRKACREFCNGPSCCLPPARLARLLPN